MSSESETAPGRRQLWGMGAFLAVTAVIFAVAVFRPRSGEPDLPRPKVQPPASPSGERVRETRNELVAELLRALETAVQAKDRKKAGELEEGLVREADASVGPCLDAVKKSSVWNFRIAALDVLSRIRTAGSVAGLEGIHEGLRPQEKALKIEIVRRLGRMSGSIAREALTRMLGREADETVRAEIGKALVALGLTSQDVAKLGRRDREVLENQVRVKDEQRAKIAAIEKADFRSDAGLIELEKVAKEESTVAIALLAFQKLEERGDGKAAAILAARAAAPADSGDQKILQTNALASLSRMKVAEARLAMRDFALGEDESLRFQSVDFVGAYGDRAMIPLLEQAALKDTSDRMVRAVEKAKTSIEARAQTAEGPKK